MTFLFFDEVRFHHCLQQLVNSCWWQICHYRLSGKRFRDQGDEIRDGIRDPSNAKYGMLQGATRKITGVSDLLS